MIIFEKRPQLLYVSSAVSFVGLYLFIDLQITQESAVLLNRNMASWPLFGAIWYHIQHDHLTYRPIMLLSILPYIVTVVGYLISIPFLNKYYLDSAPSTANNRGESVNPFLSLLPLVAIVLDIFFDAPLLRLIVGAEGQYRSMYAVPYGIFTVSILQILLVGTSGLTKNHGNS